MGSRCGQPNWKGARRWVIYILIDAFARRLRGGVVCDTNCTSAANTHTRGVVRSRTYRRFFFGGNGRAAPATSPRRTPRAAFEAREYDLRGRVRVTKTVVEAQTVVEAVVEAQRPPRAGDPGTASIFLPSTVRPVTARTCHCHWDAPLCCLRQLKTPAPSRHCQGRLMLERRMCGDGRRCRSIKLPSRTPAAGCVGSGCAHQRHICPPHPADPPHSS